MNLKSLYKPIITLSIIASMLSCRPQKAQTDFSLAQYTGHGRKNEYVVPDKVVAVAGEQDDITYNMVMTQHIGGFYLVDPNEHSFKEHQLERLEEIAKKESLDMDTILKIFSTQGNIVISESSLESGTYKGALFHERVHKEHHENTSEREKQILRSTYLSIMESAKETLKMEPFIVMVLGKDKIGPYLKNRFPILQSEYEMVAYTIADNNMKMWTNIQKQDSEAYNIMQRIKEKTQLNSN